MMAHTAWRERMVAVGLALLLGACAAPRRNASPPTPSSYVTPAYGTLAHGTAAYGTAALGLAAHPGDPPEGPAAVESDLEAIGLARDDTIFTASARTVDFNGQGLLPRLTYFQSTAVYDGNVRKSDPMDRELRVWAATLRGIIGVNVDVTLTLAVPYLRKELKTTMAGKRLRLESEGPGDTLILGKWRLFKDPVPGGTTEVAAFLGIELPTGRDDVRDEGSRLPQPLQPGSGSVDAVLGTAFTRLWDGGRWLLNADLFYKANGEGNDYRFGNVLRFDVGGQYRIIPYRFERYDEFTLNGILELNSVLAGRDTLAGDRVSGTGGLKVFVSPGLQAILTESLLLESGVQIPVYRDLKGPQLSEDFRVVAGVRWRF